MQYSLYDCVWELTLACCFNCAHCGSRAGKPRERELSVEECLSVVEQLAALGCKRVSLIGGEVFLYPGWEIVAGALAEKKIRTSIITNGYLVNEDRMHAMKRAGVRHVSVSIDGVEANHDASRMQGSYRRAIEAVRMLKRNDFLVSVITAVHQGNAQDISELYDILTGLQIDAWQIQNCSPMGNAEHMRVASTGEQWKIMSFVADKAKTGPLKLGLAHNFGYYAPEETYMRGSPLGRCAFNGCSAGLCTIGIDSVGNVRGCEALYDDCFIEGNLKERSLAEIWQDENAFAYNRKFTVECLEGRCRKCRMGEYCAAGCRSMNFFMTGSLYKSGHCVIADGTAELCDDFL